MTIYGQSVPIFRNTLLLYWVCFRWLVFACALSIGKFIIFLTQRDKKDIEIGRKAHSLSMDWIGIKPLSLDDRICSNTETILFIYGLHSCTRMHSLCCLAIGELPIGNGCGLGFKAFIMDTVITGRVNVSMYFIRLDKAKWFSDIELPVRKVKSTMNTNNYLFMDFIETMERDKNAICNWFGGYWFNKKLPSHNNRKAFQ